MGESKNDAVRAGYGLWDGGRRWLVLTEVQIDVFGEDKVRIGLVDRRADGFSDEKGGECEDC